MAVDRPSPPGQVALLARRASQATDQEKALAVCVGHERLKTGRQTPAGALGTDVGVRFDLDPFLGYFVKLVAVADVVGVIGSIDIVLGDCDR